MFPSQRCFKLSLYRFYRKLPFRNILQPNFFNSIYIVDVLIIYSQDTILAELLVNRLNSVERTTDFTFKTETNIAFTFLGIMLNRANDDRQNFVRKHAKKNDV